MRGRERKKRRGRDRKERERDRGEGGERGERRTEGRDGAVHSPSSMLLTCPPRAGPAVSTQTSLN